LRRGMRQTGQFTLPALRNEDTEYEITHNGKSPVAFLVDP
jgi:hypothetical protein